jgi:hypothetical protein
MENRGRKRPAAPIYEVDWDIEYSRAIANQLCTG